MATTLALAMRASMSATGVVSGANDAARAMDKMGDHAKQAAGSLSVMKNLDIASAIVNGATMALNAITSTVSAITSYTSRLAENVDAMNDMAERTGVGVEALQALQMAAKLSGIDDVSGAIQKMGVAIGNAAESANTQAFTRLGIDFDALRAMAPEDQFKAISQAIAALPTHAERAAAAVSIFGRAGVELLPMMEQDLEAVEARMRRLGAIVSEDQVAAIAEMNDALDWVRKTFDGIIAQVQGNLAPLVTGMANELLSFIEGFNSASGEGGTGIANAITKGLLWFLEGFATMVDAAINAFSHAGKVMEWATMAFKVMLASMLPMVSLAIGTADFAAGETTVARDFVAGVRDRFEQSQTPEAQAERDRQKAQRASDQKTALDAQMAAEKDKREADQAAKDGEKLREEMRTAEEKHAAEIKKLDDLRARQAIDEETYNRARRQADQELQDAKKREQDKITQQQEKAAREAKAFTDKVNAANEKIANKQGQIDEIEAERARALDGKNNTALQANDIRSSEGMAQYLALATGREDPAIAEYRKQTAKLEELRQELRKLQQDKVDILMGAAA